MARPSNASTAVVTAPKRLISFDGGGVKGISSCLILQAIMKQVAIVEGTDSDRERLPVDYFDLAGGTSTGGLIALMLFRLGMKTSDCITQYEQLAQAIFSPMFGPINLDKLGKAGDAFANVWLKVKALFYPSQFSAGPLLEAIDQIVKQFGQDDADKSLGGDSLLLRQNPRGNMFMCATMADQGEAAILRSYVPPDPSKDIEGLPSGLPPPPDLRNLTVAQACRATSAAPTYLPEVIINQVTFWDGGLVYNNPITRVWALRYDLASTPTEPVPVDLILSIGTSYAQTLPSKNPWKFINTVSKAADFTTNTEAKHRDFTRDIERENDRSATKVNYFRFNANTGSDSIDLADWHKMTELKADTVKYLEQEDVKAQIKKVAEMLARR
jgi:patatin-like phospholipase/acyl hydrolase